MKNSKNEILDILNRAEESGKEYNVKINSSNRVPYLLCVKPTEYGVEATISTGDKSSITLKGGSDTIINGECNLSWVAETIYSFIEH